MGSRSMRPPIMPLIIPTTVNAGLSTSFSSTSIFILYTDFGLTLEQMRLMIVRAFLLNYMAAREQITELLGNLRLKNIEELLTGDSFNLQTLSKSTSMHPILINELLHNMHSLLTAKQQDQNYTGIEFKTVVERWCLEEGNQVQKKTIDLRLARGDILEILGRTNAGKSYLLNQLITEALQKQFVVIYFDSGNNLPALKYKVRERLSHLPYFKSLKLRHFAFSSLTELFIQLFHLKKQIETESKLDYFIFIDTISRNEQPQLQNAQTISSHEFKYAEKARMLLRLLSFKTAGVVYTSRVGHSSGMFTPVYKLEKYRPKAHGSNSKQWDNIANKTVFVDFTLSEDGEQHWWLNFSKSTDAKVQKFKRHL